jgi:hypothetical protein
VSNLCVCDLKHLEAYLEASSPGAELTRRRRMRAGRAVTRRGVGSSALDSLGQQSRGTHSGAQRPLVASID